MFSALRVKNNKKDKKPVRLHIGPSTVEVGLNLEDGPLYFGKPYPTWSDVPDSLLSRVTAVSDFTLYERPDVVSDILRHYSAYEFLPAIRAAAKINTPTDKLPPGITHWLWFPMADKRHGVDYAYCHAVAPETHSRVDTP